MKKIELECKEDEIVLTLPNGCKATINLYTNNPNQFNINTSQNDVTIVPSACNSVYIRVTG